MKPNFPILRFVPFAAAFAIALSIGACTVGPDYQEPELKSPEAFSQTTGAGVASRPADLDSWWSRFGDPKLDELMLRAFQGNLDVQIAEARIKEARAVRAVTASDYYPQVNAGAIYTRQRIAENGLASSGFSGGAPPGFDPNVNLWQGGFDATWELDVFGGTRRRVEAADAQIAAVIETRRDALVSLAGEVGRNYVEFRGYQRQLRLSRGQVQSQEKTRDLVKARVDTGLASELDLSQAISELELTRAKIPGFEILAKASVHRLAILLGEPPAALDRELESETAVPKLGSEIGVGVPSDLLRRRPDVRRAERLLASANALIGAAIAEKYPKFSITGSTGFRSTDLNNLFDSGSFFYGITPRVSIPLFTGGRLDAQVDAERARTEQALLGMRQTYLIALEDVENAVARYTREQGRRDALLASANAAERALDLARALYEQGITDFLNVLVTERAMILRQTDLAQSDAQVSVEAVALYKALGGGWESAEPLASRPATAAE